MLYDGEKTENLGGGLKAIVSKEHTFGIDAVLLADFAASRSAKKLCDLGTGCGIIPLLWVRRGGEFKIDAVEIQPQAASQAKRAVALNDLCDKINVINEDLRLLNSLDNNSYDLIASNPPYKKAGSGKISTDDSALLARHEQSCTIDDIVSLSARLLKNGGRLCLCQRPERLCEILALMSQKGIEPKRLRLVQQRVNTPAWLFLVEGVRLSKPGLKIEPTLILEGSDGQPTKEINDIYGDYKS